MSLFVTSLVFGGFIALLGSWYRWANRLKDVPGPPVPSYIVGHVGELERAPMGTKMNVWAKKYGQTYKMRGPLMEPWLILGDPKGAGYVLQSKNYIRPDADRTVLELFFGKSLFAAEGDEYRRMRKGLNPAFTLQSVQEVSHTFFDLAYNLKRQYEEIIDGRESAVLDISPKIHLLALDAISMTMFMHNLSSSSSIEGATDIPALLHSMTNSPTGETLNILLEAFASLFPWLLYLPSPIKTYGDKLKHEFGKIAEEVWHGKEGAGMHAKVLDALGRAQTDQGSPISKEEAVGEIIGILFAGSETTANMISECIYELAVQPRIQEALRQELRSFQSTHGRFPEFEDLMSATALPYLDAVIRETIRTKAVLREIGRMAVHDDVISLEFPIHGSERKELHVKAGQIIQIPIRDGVNADRAIWGKDVSVFRPERWIATDELPESVDLIHAQGHVLTFGDGPKHCLGRIFAMGELKVVVSVLVSSFSFEDEKLPFDWYHLGGNTIKPLIRGREKEGVQLPLKVSCLA